MPEKLIAYALDWHLTSSEAFDALLVEPLAEFAHIEMRAWDGETLPEPLEPERPTVFCMFPPPTEALGRAGPQIVWIPMWDHARTYDQAWWNALPRDLRVVAFSGPVRERAETAGLPVLPLTYFMDPGAMEPADWSSDRVGFYWNRIGLLSPAAVERLCRALSLDRLLFRDELDPRIHARVGYDLPGRLGRTAVERVNPSSREEYLEMIGRANFYIAPREAEGVGLTFLEAMARGCCVLGYDAPTMNEYINHGKNGLLFKSSFSRLHPAALVRLARRSPHLVNVDQPWKRFAAADHRALGEQALSDHVAGRAGWLERLADYGRFLLDW